MLLYFFYFVILTKENDKSINHVKELENSRKALGAFYRAPLNLYIFKAQYIKM